MTKRTEFYNHPEKFTKTNFGKKYIGEYNLVPSEPALNPWGMRRGEDYYSEESEDNSDSEDDNYKMYSRFSSRKFRRHRRNISPRRFSTSPKYRREKYSPKSMRYRYSPKNRISASRERNNYERYIPEESRNRKYNRDNSIPLPRNDMYNDYDETEFDNKFHFMESLKGKLKGALDEAKQIAMNKFKEALQQEIKKEMGKYIGSILQSLKENGCDLCNLYEGNNIDTCIQNITPDLIDKLNIKTAFPMLKIIPDSIFNSVVSSVMLEVVKMDFVRNNLTNAINTTVMCKNNMVPSSTNNFNINYHHPASINTMLSNNNIKATVTRY